MSNNDPKAGPASPIDEDAPGPPISVADSGDTGDGGKLKMIVQLVKKCLGVKDIAAMRLSLPASLLEPIPNLEYWQYLDRPDVFAAINDSPHPFERMLAVLRFTLTKDLKFVHGKVCKPYNSVLGEHFRAHWDVTPARFPNSDSSDSSSTIPKGRPSFVSETASVRSAVSSSSKSAKSGRSSFLSKPPKSPSTAATSVEAEPDEAQALKRLSKLSLGTGEGPTETGSTGTGETARVVYVTEQVSHHPPVSAYFATCPERSLELFGIDQISAKVSGTTLRVSPGQYNQGIFVRVTGGFGEGERYHITHPIASVNGILRGSFYVTVGESTIISVSGGKHGQRFRTIIEYKEESWLGRAHFLIEGVIHTVHDGEADHEEWTKVKHVPHNRIVAVFDGSWKGHVRWRRVGGGSYPPTISSSASSPNPSHIQLPTPHIPSASASKADVTATGYSGEWATLIDMSAMEIIPKVVRPLEKQLENESRRLWENVTDNLVKREFGEATREKVGIEQRQRDEAAERKRRGVEFVPRYFEKDISKGFAELTAEGWKAVQEEIGEETSACIEGSLGTKLAAQ